MGFWITEFQFSVLDLNDISSDLGYGAGVIGYCVHLTINWAMQDIISLEVPAYGFHYKIYKKTHYIAMITINFNLK